MEFYHKIQSIINSHSDKKIFNFVKTTSNHSSYHGIYHLDLLLIKNDHDEKMNVKLQLLLMDYKISQCSIWEVLLDDTAILKHVRSQNKRNTNLTTVLYKHLINHDCYISIMFLQLDG